MGWGSIATGVATGGLSTLAGALTNKPGVAAYDPSQIVGEANKSAQTQSGIANNTLGSLNALNQPYTSGINSLGTNYQNQTGTLGQNYLNSTVGASDQLGRNLSDVLTQQSFATQPAIQNQIKEQLAASGGLQRGAYDQAVMQNGQQLAGNLFQGNQSIVNQQLADRENALGTVYGNQTGALNSAYGNNVNAANGVYNNQTSATANNGANLLGIEQNRTGAVQGAYGAQANANLAQSSASAAQQNQLLSALLGAAGTAGGAMIGGPAGAAVGGSAVRGVTQPVDAQYQAQPGYAQNNLLQSRLLGQ